MGGLLPYDSASLSGLISHPVMVVLLPYTSKHIVATSLIPPLLKKIMVELK
jgi:hypothetical protein